MLGRYESWVFRIIERLAAAHSGESFDVIGTYYSVDQLVFQKILFRLLKNIMDGHNYFAPGVNFDAPSKLTPGAK